MQLNIHFQGQQLQLELERANQEKWNQLLRLVLAEPVEQILEELRLFNSRGSLKLFYAIMYASCS